MKNLNLFIGVFTLSAILFSSCSSSKKEKYDFFGVEVIYNPNPNKFMWDLKESHPSGEAIMYYFEDGIKTKLIDYKFSRKLREETSGLVSDKKMLSLLERRIEAWTMCIDEAKKLGITKFVSRENPKIPEE